MMRFFNPVKYSTWYIQWENWGQKRAPVSFGRDRVCVTCPPKDQSSWNTKMMQPKEGFALGAGPRPPRIPAVLRMPEFNVNHLQPTTSPIPRGPPDLSPKLPTSPGKANTPSSQSPQGNRLQNPAGDRAPRALYSQAGSVGGQRA